jgi:hypothetical protein
MTDWLPCLYALFLMGAAATVGFWLGRWREQLALLEMCKPTY